MINVMRQSLSFSFPPKVGEELTIRITSMPFSHKMALNKEGYTVLAKPYKLEVFPKNVDGQIIELTQDIYKGMLAQLKMNNIPVDQNLECIKRVWTIAGKGEKHRVTLRTDLL